MKIKKLLLVLLTLAVLLFAAGCGEKTLAGSGTEADPYIIDSAEALWTMAKLINSEDTYDDYYQAHYRITADIDLGGKTWTPIGSIQVGFQGVLDGGGHTVSGIRAEYKQGVFGNGSANVGFIAEVSNGAVRNLTIRDSVFSGDGEGAVQVGALAGRVYKSIVENCHTAAGVSVASSYQAGGIAGNISNEAPIVGCTNAATVSIIGDMGNAGGIAGYSKCDFVNCHNSGAITGERAAGIAATCGGSLLDCSNSGTIAATKYAGGIVTVFGDGALNSNDNDFTISMERCSNTGSISTSGRVAGGIAAGAQGGAIRDCVNEGTVTSTAGEAGGIVGYYLPSTFGTASPSFELSGCTNSGAVSTRSAEGNSAAGGIIGQIYSCNTLITITDCSNTALVESDGQRDVMDSTGEAGGIVGYSACAGLELRSCTNSGEIRGVAVVGGIIGFAIAPADAAAPTRLAVTDCANSGDVLCSYHGGLVTMCYCGGILGFVGDNEGPNTAFETEEFLNCSNSGSLSCDISPYCSDDICASKAEPA